MRQPRLWEKFTAPEEGDCQVCPLYMGPNFKGTKQPIPEEEGVCIRDGGLCDPKKEMVWR